MRAKPGEFYWTIASPIDHDCGSYTKPWRGKAIFQASRMSWGGSQFMLVNADDPEGQKDFVWIEYRMRGRRKTHYIMGDFQEQQELFLTQASAQKAYLARLQLRQADLIKKLVENETEIAQVTVDLKQLSSKEPTQFSFEQFCFDNADQEADLPEGVTMRDWFDNYPSFYLQVPDS